MHIWGRREGEREPGSLQVRGDPGPEIAETIPGVVNVHQGETKIANEDGRLPHTDNGT
jgi:hypothetical protein